MGEPDTYEQVRRWAMGIVVFSRSPRIQANAICQLPRSPPLFPEEEPGWSSARHCQDQNFEEGKEGLDEE